MLACVLFGRTLDKNTSLYNYHKVYIEVMYLIIVTIRVNYLENLRW